jgi:hypothetical protein
MFLRNDDALMAVKRLYICLCAARDSKEDHSLRILLFVISSISIHNPPPPAHPQVVGLMPLPDT